MLGNADFQNNDPIAIRIEDDQHMHFFERRMKCMGAALDCNVERMMVRTAPMRRSFAERFDRFRSSSISSARDLFAMIGAFFVNLKNRLTPPAKQQTEVQHIRTHIGNYF